MVGVAILMGVAVQDTPIYLSKTLQTATLLSGLIIGEHFSSPTGGGGASHGHNMMK